jgi:hypothetical protein
MGDKTGTTLTCKVVVRETNDDNGCQLRVCELTLKHRDRHDSPVGLVKMLRGFLD